MYVELLDFTQEPRTVLATVRVANDQFVVDGNVPLTVMNELRAVRQRATKADTCLKLLPSVFSGTYLRAVFHAGEKPSMVLKGGAGSGNFKHMGRPGFVGGAGGGGSFGIPQHQGALFKKISEADGGFTYDAQTGSLKTTGFALSIHPDRTRIMDVKDVNLKALVEYATANHDLLTKTNNYLGGWHDPETHKVYLDVSTIVDTAAEAESQGRAAKQISYFDFSLGKSVNIDYTDEKEPYVKAARETHVLRHRSKRRSTDA